MGIWCHASRNIPNDWVVPSGMEEDGYVSISDLIMSSKNVLDSAELKKLKINREDELLNRAINYINHCDTHKYSKYCHLVALRNVIHNKKKHKDVKEDDIFSKGGDMFVRIKVIECRMKVGKLRFLINQVKIILLEVLLYVYTTLYNMRY